MKPDRNLEKSSVALSRQSGESLLIAWKAGNDDAARLLVDRYLARLTALIRAKLSRKFSGQLDPEDIVFSAWRSFFVATREGSFFKQTADSVWSLLATIALRKLSKSVDYHTAQRRSVDLQFQVDSMDLLHSVSRDATPEHAAIVEDELNRIFSRLSSDEASVLSLKLNGLTQSQIAKELGKSERTIRRIETRIRVAVCTLSGSEHLFSEYNEDRVEKTTAATSIESKMLSDSPSTLPKIGYRQFVLGRMIGQGGFGKVYRASMQHNDAMVAVKFLKRKLWSNHAVKKAFLNEVDTVAQLNNDGIIKYSGWGESPHGGVFIIMELVDGMQFDEWLKCCTRTPNEIVTAVCEICLAIRSAHKAGIVHGDLTPANVMQRPNGRWVVLDFGMSSAIQLENGNSSRGEVNLGGTAGFLAPEQVSSAFGSRSEQTDVYGIGGLLHFGLFGRATFIGATQQEVIAQVLSSTNAVDSSQSTNDISKSLSTILYRCLQKAPDERPDSVEQVIRLLDSCAS